LKANIVAACKQSGASVSAVAQSNDITPNIVRRWIREQQHGVPWSEPGVNRAPTNYRAEYKQRIVEQCLKPGAQVTSVAYAHHISPNTVHDWIAKHRQRRPNDDADFYPVTVQELARAAPRSDPFSAIPTPAKQTRPHAQATDDGGQIDLEIGGARLHFGRSSEKGGGLADQLELSLEEMEGVRAEHAAALTESPAKPREPRAPLPEHLPRETIEHRPEHTCCPQCGGQLKSLGEDIAEMLEYVPASFRVIRYVRPKLACAKCEAIVQAPAPSRPIARGLPGAGLLAHVLTAKYCDHLPLYRQSGIYAREGVKLERSTLADWVGQCHALLRPLVNAIERHVLSGAKLHADDTPVPVLEAGKGQTKTGRLWTYVRDGRPAADDTPPAVWFAYTPNRRGEHPQAHLKSFRGLLQADAFAGYAPLYESGQIKEAACWAHVRRKFYDIAQAQASPVAQEALRRIGALYAIEEDIRGKAPQLRGAERQARAGPLIEAMRRWLDDTIKTLSQKSKLAEAIRYALVRWQALARYVGDGAIEIDNSAAERALRTVALGRKNYLFAGSDAGGQRAASIAGTPCTARSG
jgi:transposase/transposase-like protein